MPLRLVTLIAIVLSVVFTIMFFVTISMDIRYPTMIVILALTEFLYFLGGDVPIACSISHEAS